MKEQPLAIVYRHELLPYSETFVREQAKHLRRYRMHYAGLRRVEGLELPEGQVTVASNGGRLGEYRFLLTGAMPAMHALRPDVVHAHFEGGGIAAMAMAARLRVPLVVTCHGWDVTVADEHRWPNGILRRLYHARRKKLQAQGAVFIAVSAHIKECMLRLGYPEERTEVHRIGVDCELHGVSDSALREELVVFVGRLIEKKGCADLIEAMGTAANGARLVIIGDGPLRPQLAALARERYPEAEFLGRRPPEEVRHWMGRARVLCVPTVRAANGDMDGCAMVFAEAQAMGLPVVSYEGGGTSEAVINGKTGLLVKARDTAALGAAISRLVQPSALWDSMSRAARTHATEHFDIVRQTAKLEELYDWARREYSPA